MRNVSVSTVCLFFSVDIDARSPVIIPSLIVFSIAFSSLSAYSHNAGVESSSPLLRKAPVQAKTVATGFVDVFSPLRYL